MMSPEAPHIPDRAERDRALQSDASFIVQAPAGSGKTTLLATRFVHLLARVQRPEEILAITFTKKAAAEMRHRVLALLREDTPTAHAVRKRNAERGWQLFDNPNVLKIQTIDSFALEVASQTPFLDSAAGLTITEHAETCYARAVQQLLARLYGNDPSRTLIADFLAFLDNDAARAERLLTFMLSRRDQWLSAVTAVAAGESLDTTRTLLERATASLRAGLEQQLDARLDQSDTDMLATLASHLGTAPGWDALGATLMTKTGTLRKRLNRKDGLDDPDLRRRANQWLESLHARDLQSLLASHTRLPAADGPAGNLPTLHLCCICLALAAAELDALLQRDGILDFTGLLLRAKQALRDEHGPTDLALYLDYRIHHILVDEYQDTSRAQLEFFQLLTEEWRPGDGNTFFAVGDPMQSIYRFRDADVSIFADTRTRGLAGMPLATCTLEANFRSDPAVVGWCNELFERTFGRGNASQLGEVNFSAAVPMVPPEPGAAVQCLQFTQMHDETRYLARHISMLLKRDADATIAVLCRARNHVAPLLKLLGQAGIAVQATDMDPLADRPVIQDLMNLHSVLLQPSNRVAWFALLRSPMFGLSLAELTAVAALAQVADFAALAEQQPQLERLTDALTWARQRLYEVPLREALEGLWLRCGGADAYDALERANAQAWFDLVDDLKADAYSATALEGVLQNLFAASDASARVQVMTIHKAKGLEFDHVLVPYLDKRPQNDQAQLLMWRPAEDGLLMGVRGDDVHTWLTYEERERARNEEKRLLYVACTRARHSLVTSFTCAADTRPSGMARWLTHAASRREHVGPHVDEPPEWSRQGDLFDQKQLRRLPRDYVWCPPVYAATPTTGTEAPSGSIDQIGARYEVALGLLVHQALAWLADLSALPDGEDAVSSFVSTRLQPRLQRWMRALYVEETDRQTLAQACAAQIHLTLKDPQGRWLLQAHEQARSEWPLTGLHEGAVTRVVLDRTFVVDGQRWIVDFKTGQPHHGEQQTAFVDAEVSRYAPQLARYRAITGALGAEPVVTALYFTALSRLRRVD